MPRPYKVLFENVAVTAAQDLVQIVGPAAGKMIRITRCWLGHCASTPATA